MAILVEVASNADFQIISKYLAKYITTSQPSLEFMADLKFSFFLLIIKIALTCYLDIKNFTSE